MEGSMKPQLRVKLARRVAFRGQSGGTSGVEALRC